MQQIFESWTEYDNWLVENYINFNIYNVNEIDGKIHIEYCEKGKLSEILKQKESSNSSGE